VGFILWDEAGHDIHVNAWNWGALHWAVGRAEPPVFEAQVWEPLRYNLGASLSELQVAELRQYLEGALLPRISAGCRMKIDLSVTDQPDDGTFHREKLEENYSLHHQVLVNVIAFLKEAKGTVRVG